jgi:hypothetical protein
LLFCQNGDSGSLILDANASMAFGLLWAKANGSRRYMCATKNVETQLGVNVAWQ